MRTGIVRKKYIFGACFFLALMVIVAILWPTASYDIERVDPRLRELVPPFQSVDAGVYLDGGSVGVSIVDRDSRRLELALPVSPEGGRRYPRLFIGAKHMSKTGAVEVAFSEDTRRMLVSVLEQHAHTTNFNDYALLGLRGAPRDYVRMFGRVVGKYCKSPVK